MKKEFTITTTKILYGWSKYGGARMAASNQLFTKEEQWFCQCCSTPQPPIVPKYMVPLDPLMREFISVCSKCKNEKYPDIKATFKKEARPEEYEPHKERQQVRSLTNKSEILRELNSIPQDYTNEQHAAAEYQLCLDFLENVAENRIKRHSNIPHLASFLLGEISVFPTELLRLQTSPNT